MSAADVTPDEFSTAMQQLSAEAEKILAPKASPNAKGTVQTTGDPDLSRRLLEMERTLAERIELLAQRVLRSNDMDIIARFDKVDEQLSSIRNTDQMNKRLVDSLHAELVKYRDNFLHESLQKPFIHDLVQLFDDLTGLAEQLRTAADQKLAKVRLSQWQENLENSIHSLLEILHRFEVREIEPKDKVDRGLHKVMSFEPAEFAEDDGCIVMRLRRGFVWRGKVIRPEEVIAKKFN